jgi:hypothetical protein
MSNVLLTERDTGLLHDCYQNTALSISQIRRRHFPNCGKATALNRLSKLKTEGYLKSQRVGIVIYQGMPKKIGAVYQITRAAISYLKSRYPKEAFREEPLQLNTGALPHDLLLTDVVTELKKRHPGKLIMRGYLARHLEGAKRVPDAVILDPSGWAECAIELELTAKSKERYRDIILQYRLESRFPKVLYIAGDASTLEKIKCQIIQGKANPKIAELSTGKFNLVLLHDLLKDETGESKVTNLQTKGGSQ